ncbi:MAG: hypothetical protein DHS20C15_07300 [Planctomycetota bacterium]|nr:MAG: hypothetical protein DHS20C15_07300 [Planctomycetota bacterium]
MPTDFAALQDAIDAAAPGDTIVIDGGEHEYLRIDKPLTLVGRATNTPFLKSRAGGPVGPGIIPQEPALSIEDTEGLVTLIGVRVGGASSAQILANSTTTLMATGPGDLRVLHSTVRALDWLDGSEFAPANGALFAGFGLHTLTVVDSTILGTPHLAEGGLYCYSNLHDGSSALGAFELEQPMVLLDTHVAGGASYDDAFYGDGCHSITSFVPTSCDDITKGLGGTGVASTGEVWMAGSSALGGRGARLFWTGRDAPAGFPCEKSQGPAFAVAGTLDLDTGAQLHGTGALVEGRLFTLEWQVAANSVLLAGPALVNPQARAGSTPLFVDPDQLRMKPLEGAGAGSLSILVPSLSDEMLGQVMAFQIFTPGVGLSRPLIAAMQPN